ncbi:hypothetical protein LIER_17376 [Lithospermum erythrorhizon]|uniref:Uncharacterized protein n=1 Tax=Lithospermum erythrorhizon TaxID=34254 RepID=A0AAV3QEF9_LITER
MLGMNISRDSCCRVNPVDPNTPKHTSNRGGDDAAMAELTPPLGRVLSFKDSPVLAKTIYAGKDSEGLHFPIQLILLLLVKVRLVAHCSGFC